MDLLHFENLRTELISKIAVANSSLSRLVFYFDYFKKILAQNTEQLYEVFIAEFLEDYFNVISRFEVWGIAPELAVQIIEQLKSLKQKHFVAGSKEKIDSEIERIEEQISRLNFILEGEDFENGFDKKAYFPLIDPAAPEGFYGMLDSVTIRISKAESQNSFIIIPSETEIEKRILEQCKTSWEVALRLFKNYVRRYYKFHEIIISFDKREGFYEGESLGAALTLSFLETLMNFYNPIYNIQIKELTVFTGGISEEGKLIGVGKKCIEQKIRTFFYSPAETFIIPKEDENHAAEELKRLKSFYPKRKLKLVAAEEVIDILNRRDIMAVRKRNILARGGKLISKHWASAAAALLMTILLSWFFVIDLDDNPVDAKVDGAFVHIVNKRGKILNSIKFATDPVVWRSTEKSNSILFVDIDEDGENEIITASGLSKFFSNDPKEELTGWNKKLEKLWSVGFYDTVSSIAETMSRNYSIWFLDTLSKNEKKILFTIGRNHESYASFVLGIDLRTGKRLKEILWNDGHILFGELIDIDGDNQKEIVFCGYNNAYEKNFIGAVELDSMNGMAVSTSDRALIGKTRIPLKRYILLPKSDYFLLQRMRISPINNFNFVNHSKNEMFQLSQIQEGNFYSNCAVGYKFSKKLDSSWVVILSDFRVVRDSLVASGKLNPPYTDTQEYKQLLVDSMLHWNGSEFVHWWERK